MKMKRTKITPFKSGETVILGCGAKFNVECAINDGISLNITNLVVVDAVDMSVSLPIRDEALDSLKLLIKRLEKTFQKE
jgi:hypothetical protein